MYSMVQQGVEILINPERDINDFGHLMHQSWQIKRGLNGQISTEFIDHLYQTAIDNGAIGGKLLGAGGGGFFLFYVPKNIQKKFIKSLKKMIIIPFKFNNEGSEIMFNRHEDSVL